MEPSVVQNGSASEGPEAAPPLSYIDDVPADLGDIPDSGRPCADQTDGTEVRSHDMVDSYDPEFAYDNHRLVAYEQLAPRGQHCLQIKNNQINVTGDAGDSHTLLRIHITGSGSGSHIVVIEGVEATKAGEHSLVSMNKQHNRLELIKKQTEIARIKEVSKSVLFEMKYKGEQVYFQSYDEKKELLIRFSQEGSPASPTGGLHGGLFSIFGAHD